MAQAISMAFGGKTKQQKALEAEQAKTAADALAQKVTALQDDVGTRTRDLVARYGIAGMSGRPAL